MMNDDRNSKHDTTSTGDRRAEHRTAPIYRPVLIETNEFSGFCLVRDLSPGGMMGQVYTQFAEQQPVTIWFHPDRGIAGTIAWSEGDHVGIRFTESIHVESVLSELSAEYVFGNVNR